MGSQCETDFIRQRRSGLYMSETHRCILRKELDQR